MGPPVQQRGPPRRDYWNQGRNVTLFAVAAILSLHIVLESRFLPPVQPTSYDQPIVKHKSLGRVVVEHSYKGAFADLVKACNSSDLLFKKCLSDLSGLGSNPAGVYHAKWPWWFRTMVRDSLKPRGGGVFGAWHVLQMKNPNLQMCVYEKGGTKQWRQFHCDVLNRTEDMTNTTRTTCFTRQGLLRPNTKRSVFLRDPLERFLSGFLDKCAGRHRQSENHCEPLSVFKDKETMLVEDFLEDGKRLFEIYVDTMPLDWNLHFFPMSFYCGGLYRSISNYDFVGNMDVDFYKELGRFKERFPAIAPFVDTTFEVEEKKQNTTNVGVETRAASRTLQFYTPRTVRRVLEYYAIDYIMLNLPIPTWAEELLEQDILLS